MHTTLETVFEFLLARIGNLRNLILKVFDVIYESINKLSVVENA